MATTRHSIRVVVQVGEQVGSVIVTLDGDEDGFDGVDFGELAEVCGRALAVYLTADDDDDIETIDDLMGMDDDDDEDDHTIN